MCGCVYHPFTDIPTYENHKSTPSPPSPHILIPPLLLPSSCHTLIPSPSHIPHIPSSSHTHILIPSPSHTPHLSHTQPHPTLSSPSYIRPKIIFSSILTPDTLSPQPLTSHTLIPSASHIPHTHPPPSPIPTLILSYLSKP